MRLKKEQRNQLLEWVAAGLETGEINLKAGELNPPFSVSRAQVDYYRKTRKVDLQEMLKDEQFDALTSGLAQKAERVKRLQLLAALMEEDLFGGVLWNEDVKMIGSGEYQERVEFERFNSAEVDQYRGVLDDIAKEMGDRKDKPGDVNVNVNFDVEKWKLQRQSRLEQIEEIQECGTQDTQS